MRAISKSQLHVAKIALAERPLEPHEVCARCEKPFSELSPKSVVYDDYCQDCGRGIGSMEHGASRKVAGPENYEIKILKYGSMGYMAKVFACDASGNTTSQCLYHGEYLPSAAEAVQKAEAHVTSNQFFE